MDILQFIGIIGIPAVALIVSSISYYKTNRMSKKVNSKDYEISENLKYELMQLIAVLKSLDSKAALSPGLNVKADYLPEINEISKLVISPSYLVFLRSIDNEKDRSWVDLNIHYLVIRGNEMSRSEVRQFSNRVLDLIKNTTSLKNTLNLDVFNLMKEFCDMKGAVPKYEEKEAKNDNEMFSLFLSYLRNNGVDDPDVNVFYGVVNGDEELLKQALNAGGNPNITDKAIIKKYKDLYLSFIEELKKK